MTIHVPISEAERRLGELVAAAARGDDVVLDLAGTTRVRLVAVEADPETIARRAEKRLSAFGMYKHLIGDAESDIDVLAIKADERWAERDGRRFGDPD